MKRHKKLLSHGDVLLRVGDAELLTGPHWLNDQIIAFYFETLAQAPPSLLLVPGATTFLMITAGAELAGIVLKPLSFASKSLALFAVNNNPDATEAEGGSHWSLLAFSRPDNTLRHFDSCRGTNAAAARSLAAALQPVLPPGTKLIEQATPQQQNGYDCGMVVLAIADLLTARFSKSASTDEAAGAATVIDFEVEEAVVGHKVLTTMREELHALIMRMAAEQQQQRRV